MVMQIGDVKRRETFEIIKRVSRKYWLVLLEDKLLADVVFKIDRYDLEEVLREFLKVEIDRFLYRLCLIKVYGSHLLWTLSRQLMKSGMITVEIVVVVDESQVDIFFFML